MRRFLAVALAVTSMIALSGCSKQLQEAKDTFAVITSDIKNPISYNTSYDVEVGAAAARRAALEVMRTRQCRRSETPSASNICVPRSVKVTIQDASSKLTVALTSFRKIADSGSTLSIPEMAKDVIAAIRSINATLFINNLPGG